MSHDPRLFPPGPRGLPKLDDVIRHVLKHPLGAHRTVNTYVDARGFDALYIRLTRRYIDGVVYAPVLDIANVQVARPGQGTFTRLVARLRAQYPTLHLYVEQARPRFGAYLLRHGFRQLNPHVHGESYLLAAGTPAIGLDNA